MNPRLLIFFFFFGIISVFAQTKVSGYVFDENGQSVAFANVIFKGSTEGTITNEDGRFYLESENTWNTVIISFLGYEMQEITLDKKVNYDLKFVLKEEDTCTNTLVKDLSLPDTINMVSIKRSGQIIIPKGHTRIEVGDVITVYGRIKAIEGIKDFLNTCALSNSTNGNS